MARDPRLFNGPSSAGLGSTYGTEVTLRDLYAGLAMAALIVAGREFVQTQEGIAAAAWSQAEAMLAKRADE
jgi:hypothetical protein